MILLTPIFGWWLFVVLALLYVYLVKLPYEIIPIGFLFDNFYYFGSGAFDGHPLTIFTFVLMMIALFLEDKIDWVKKI
jgi:hypothetical protein